MTGDSGENGSNLRGVCSPGVQAFSTKNPPVDPPPEPGRKRPPVEPPKRSPKPSPIIDPPVEPDPGKKPPDDPSPVGDPPDQTKKPIRV